LRTTRLYTRIRVYRIDDDVTLAAGAPGGELRSALDAEGLRWLDVSDGDLSDALARRDDRRVALVATGATGEQTVLAAASAGRVSALVLVGVPLSANALALVREWPELPILAVADPADREGLRGAVDAYLASGHSASDVIVGPLADAWAPAATWLRTRMTRVPQSDEVVLSSQDGWELHATRWLPAPSAASAPVSAVRSAPNGGDLTASTHGTLAGPTGPCSPGSSGCSPSAGSPCSTSTGVVADRARTAGRTCR
jgi:hypothetical protein